MVSPFIEMDPKNLEPGEEKSVLNKIVNAEKNLKLLVKKNA